MADLVRIARPLALAALVASAVLLAADVVVATNGSPAHNFPFSGTTPDNRTYVGLRVMVWDDEATVRVPRLAYVGGAMLLSGPDAGQCIVNFPNATLYVTTRADTKRLREGTEPLAPLRVERAGDASQEYCSRDGFPQFVEVNAPPGSSRLAPEETRQDCTAEAPCGPPTTEFLPPLGFDFVYVFPSNVTDVETDYWSLVVPPGGGSAGGLAESWSNDAVQDGAVLEPHTKLLDRSLRWSATAAFAIFLGTSPALFREAPGPVPSSTEAALSLRDAGESHLRRLRAVWIQVGLLLAMVCALFAMVALLLWASVPKGAVPWQSWPMWMMVATLVVSAATLATWAAGFRQRHRELRRWRKSFAEHPADNLDDL
jgi:hypothetical protein